MKSCRPFLGLDGCHMENYYKGVLLVASTMDSDNQIFSVAFGMVESESIASWLWFSKPSTSNFHLQWTHHHKRSFNEVFPKMQALEFTFYLSKNNHGRGLDHYFNMATTTFYSNVKEQYLERLRIVSPRAYEWLDERSDLTWSREDYKIACKDRL